MRSLRAVWSLTRLEHGFIYGLGVIAGVFITLGYIDTRLSFFGFLTALFLQASAFALNDYFDYEVDVANRRLDRPIVRGDISRREALIISVIFAVPGFLFAYIISFIAFILALAITLLGYIYDVKLKEYGIAGNVYIAFSMVAPFIFGSVVAGKPNTQIVILSAIAFLSGLAREIMKGIEDVEGDALRNVKTVARVYGIRKAEKASASLYFVSITLSLIVIAIPEYMDAKYLVPVLICDYILVRTAIKLVHGIKRSEISEMRKKTMIALFFGLIAFILGSF